jgi:ABC-type antimicrobial peptide transport system permease subunit
MAQVLRDGLLLVSCGSLLGLLGALMTGRLVTSFLYGVQARDWMVFIGGPLLLLVVGLFASYFPARRAASVSPMEAARAE